MKSTSVVGKNLVSWLGRKGRQGSLYNIVVYILLIDLAFVFLYPFIYMMVTSVKSYSDINDITVKWLPNVLKWDNWATAWETMDASRTIFNSLFVSLTATLGHLAACSFVAYGFARYKFPLKSVFFFCVLLTFIIPAQAVTIPQYRLYNQMGLMNGYWPMILPTFLGLGLRGGLFIFLFRQFFLGFPAELEEAAEVDGTNPLMTFIRIILPSSGSIMLVCFVLSMVWHWNDYYEPGIYLRDFDLFLLPQTLPEMYARIQAAAGSMMDGETSLELREKFHAGVAMAGTGIAVSPLLLMYLVLQNKFVESIDRTGLTGQ